MPKPIRVVAALAFGLGLGACAPPPAEPSNNAANLGPENYSGCAVTVSFGSYAMGIDDAAYAKMREMVTRDYPKAQIVEHKWGREGERTWCITVPKRGDAPTLATRLRTLIPANPLGPIAIEVPAQD